MKIIVIVFALLVVVVVSGFRYLKYRMGNTADEKNLQSAIDREINKLVQHAQAPGLVIGVYKDGKSFIKGYGAVSKTPDAAPEPPRSFKSARSEAPAKLQTRNQAYFFILI